MQVIINNNRLPFKNNIEYTWARFMEVSKIKTKVNNNVFYKIGFNTHLIIFKLQRYGKNERYID